MQENLITYAESKGTYNCFTTISEADIYHFRRLGNKIWKDAVDEDKTSVLFQATDVLHRQDWKGVPTVVTQNLAFPRNYLPNRNSLTDSYEFSEYSYINSGLSYFGDQLIPKFLKDATAELANFFLVKSKSGKDEVSQYTDQLSEIKIGKIVIKKREESNYITSLPYQVRFMINDFLESIKEEDHSLNTARSFSVQ